MDNNQNILKVSNLIMKFPIKSDFIFKKKMFLSAVDNVSFNMKQGDSIGIVGESGSGKTTVGRIISRLIRPTSGSIVFEGKEVSNITGKELKMFMPNIQTVFQDPYTSLNPRLTIGEIISEPMKINKWSSKNKINKRTKHLIDLVGLPQASIYRFPSDFSGGQRQRIAICRAIAINPKIVICDEAVSALDVSMQAKILNLLVDLKNDLKLTYIFISHDLSVVRMICDKIIVMYMGKIVETSPSETEPAANKAPTMVMPEIAFAPDIRGVCNVGGTLLMSSNPRKIARTNTVMLATSAVKVRLIQPPPSIVSASHEFGHPYKRVRHPYLTRRNRSPPGRQTECRPLDR